MYDQFGDITPETKERLKNLLESQNLVSAGKMALVGLEPLKRKFGPAWDKYVQRVHGHMAKVLSNVLMLEEVYLQVDEENYIIVFRHRDQAEARVICEKIIQSVHETFLGEPDLNSLRLESIVLSLNHEALARAMNIELRPHLDLPAATAGAGKNAPRATKPAVIAGFNAQDINYTPIWDIRRQYVYAYKAAAFARAERQSIMGYAVLANPHLPQNILTYDMALIDKVAEDFAPLHRQNDPVLGFLPVSYVTLSTVRHATDYHRHFGRRLDKMSNRLIFELNHVTPGTPRWRALEMTAVLKRFARGVFMMVDHTWQDLGLLAEVPLLGVTLNLERDPRSSARIKADIGRIANFCRKHRLLFGVGGVHDIGLAVEASEAGARFAYGHYLVATVEKPLPSRALTWMHSGDMTALQESLAAAQ